MNRVQTALIVDDDERIAEMVGALLSREGFKVSTARDGLRGVASYFRNPTDFVVTDLDMPKLNGAEMANFIRAVNPDVKIIYMTGAVDDFRVLLDREAREFGARVLRKPFAGEKLIEQLTGTEDSAAAVLPFRATKNKLVKVA